MRAPYPSFCGLLAAGTLAAAALQAAPVPKWSRFEAVLRASSHAADPSSADVKVDFHAPSGAVRRVDAFWDGGRVWKVRFAPDEEGRWTWSSQGPDPGLTRSGSFTCTAAAGRGPVVVSADRRRLAYADGTPLFWLADTAWNGPLWATGPDWRMYLARRKQQGFTAIQWVTTHWRGAPNGDARGRMPYTGTGPIRINPEFFRSLEQRHEDILRAGLVSAPVMLWAIATPKGPEINPGLALPEGDAIRLVRYELARWGSDRVVWLLNGDGDYRGSKAERWKRIGRGAFDGVRHAPVSLHPGGRMWVMEEFRREPWLDIAGYQSGHADSDGNSAWIHSGPASREWEESPVRPVISLEAPYDRPPDRKLPSPETILRRNHLWSLLNAPVAGVTYGVHGIWGWSDGVHPAPGHGATVWPHWKELLDLPGAGQIARICQLLQSLDWTRLRPAPGILAEQPGSARPSAWVSAAQTPSRSLTLVYTPESTQVKLRPDALPPSFEAGWVSAGSGERSPAAGDGRVFRAPGEGDWILVVKAP